MYLVLTANLSSNPPLTINATPAKEPPETILCKSVRHKRNFAEKKKCMLWLNNMTELV